MFHYSSCFLQGYTMKRVEKNAAVHLSREHGYNDIRKTPSRDEKHNAGKAQGAKAPRNQTSGKRTRRPKHTNALSFAEITEATKKSQPQSPSRTAAAVAKANAKHCSLRVLFGKTAQPVTGCPATRHQVKHTRFRARRSAASRLPAAICRGAIALEYVHSGPPIAFVSFLAAKLEGEYNNLMVVCVYYVYL
ncbi:hypothetical protein NPIL_68271 [Nephila pilipes]|uniref:Uncharacterized protein n=1 Tax=Nephila pilipes TaxID=299642 RepID=A0A8X6UE69_NEPPI|nr:hypothetical protein NPIL_68271 [Nephila pilipes]